MLQFVKRLQFIQYNNQYSPLLFHLRAQASPTSFYVYLSTFCRRLVHLAISFQVLPAVVLRCQIHLVGKAVHRSSGLRRTWPAQFHLSAYIVYYFNKPYDVTNNQYYLQPQAYLPSAFFCNNKFYNMSFLIEQMGLYPMIDFRVMNTCESRKAKCYLFIQLHVIETVLKK